MKRNNTGIILGLLFIAAGLGYAAKAIGWLDDFTIFFDGWWSLFIIVPCFFGLFKEGKDKTAYLVGLVIGFFFLLLAQDFISWSMLMPFLIALVCLVIGIKLIFPRTRAEKTVQFHYYSNASGNTDTADGQRITEEKEAERRQGRVVCSAVLSGRDIRVDNEEFTGGDLTAILGGISLNLKNAIIRENVTLKVQTVLGGIDILLPNYVRVIVEDTPILGGVENSAVNPLGADANTPTIYIKATCILGGVDIK